MRKSQDMEYKFGLMEGVMKVVFVVKMHDGIGFWKNDKASGKGIFYHSNGDIYDGEWVDDKA